MAEIKIVGNTSDAVQAINDVNSAIKETGQTTEKIAQTEEEKWKEERERSKRKKAWIKEQENLEKELGATTSKVTELAKKSWTEMNSKYQFFKTGLTDGIGILTKFKDEIMALEGIATQKTALKLLSDQGEDLNTVLERTVEITKGVATGNDILATVNQLMVKEFKLTSESLEKLIDVSATYSSITGDSMNSVMEKLATASQKESEKILEKLGIYIDIGSEMTKYARTIGKTVDSLSEQEKQNQLIIISTDAMKTKFDELGLTAASLESPITHTFKRSEQSINEAKEAVVNTLGAWYVKSIEIMEGVFEKYEEFSDRLQGFIQDGFEGRDRAAKKWADKRYAEQQVQLVKELEASEKAETMKTDTFIAFSEQQKAYGIKNNEIIYANYVKMLSDLKKVQGKTIFISSKLFDIDASKDKRNLANEMFFTEAEVDDYTKKSIEKYQKYWDALSKEQEKILKNKMSKLEQQYKNKQDLAIQQSKFNDSLFETGIVVDDDFFESTDDMKRTQKAQEDSLKMEKELSERKIEFKRREKETLMNQEIESQEKIKSYMVDAANNMYSGLLEGRANFLRETIAMSMQRAGAEIFNDGLQGLWQGGRWALSPIPTIASRGFATINYSLAEIGAGLALGYAGTKIMPKTGKASEGKDTTAKDSNQINDNKKQEYKVSTFLFPSERDYLQSLQKSNMKLNG